VARAWGSASCSGSAAPCSSGALRAAWSWLEA
jgi:hypothetical protein